MATAMPPVKLAIQVKETPQSGPDGFPALSEWEMVITAPGEVSGLLPPDRVSLTAEGRTMVFQVYEITVDSRDGSTVRAFRVA